jgi:hypothetical protein
MGMPVSKSVGNGVKGVLMEIKEEWYKEDSERKLAAVDSQESSMRQSKGGVEGAYGDINLGAG